MKEKNLDNKTFIICKNIVLCISIIVICMSMIGCSSGKRTVANQGRMYNNDDEVKVVRLRKVVTIEGRNYYVIYAQFKNNSDKQIRNLRFNLELSDKSNKVIQTGSMEIDRIEPGRTEQGEYFVTLTEATAIDNMGYITFTSYSHSETEGTVSCSREISYNFNSIRIEEMKE